MADTQQQEEELNFNFSAIDSEALAKIDYKMVTFNLAGKDYGIDIMTIREIARGDRFTYVPNAPDFVRGVYNLRGEIISIIDLRRFFGLEPQESSGPENILISRIGDNTLGIIVDSIDKVVGIDSRAIQPSHPLFADVNVRYIYGIVEKDDRLYIILDINKIFGDHHDAENLSAGEPSAASSFQAETQAAPADAPALAEVQAAPAAEKIQAEAQTAPAAEKKEAPDKAQTPETPYVYSRRTGQLWDDELVKAFSAIVPPKKSGYLHIWNPGCGKGYESYSLACAVLEAGIQAVPKIYAQDNDFAALSAAPGLSFNPDEADSIIKKHLVESPSGWRMSSEVKNMVIFEYRDLANKHVFPGLDMVVARDVVSFLKPEARDNFYAELKEMAQPGVILVLGDHEKRPMDENAWQPLTANGLSVYKKI